jgi:hypothetical protein
MRALRLPIRASATAYWFAAAVRGFLLFRVRRSAPDRLEVPSRPGPCCAGCPHSRLSSVDANGISQVFRRSIPCLCCVPRPRSNRRALAVTVTPMLPPLCAQRRLRTMADFGAHWRSFGTCCPTLHASRCRSHARLASGWPARPLPRGSRTLWTATRGFSLYRRSSPSPALLTLAQCAALTAPHALSQPPSRCHLKVLHGPCLD